MNKGIVRKISILVTIAVLSGCSSVAPRYAAGDSDRPILSAAEAETMIRVTVKQPDPTPGTPTFAALSE